MAYEFLNEKYCNFASVQSMCIWQPGKPPQSLTNLGTKIFERSSHGDGEITEHSQGFISYSESKWEILVRSSNIACFDLPFSWMIRVFSFLEDMIRALSGHPNLELDTAYDLILIPQVKMVSGWQIHHISVVPRDFMSLSCKTVGSQPSASACKRRGVRVGSCAKQFWSLVDLKAMKTCEERRRDIGYIWISL